MQTVLPADMTAKGCPSTARSTLEVNGEEIGFAVTPTGNWVCTEPHEWFPDAPALGESFLVKNNLAD